MKLRTPNPTVAQMNVSSGKRQRVSVPGHELYPVVDTPVTDLLDSQREHGAGEVEAHDAGDLRVP